MVRAVAVAIIAVALLVGLLSSQARAQGPAGITLVLIIDNSGSMANADPGDLRLAAVSQLVDLLETGDEISVISFADQSTVLVPLTEIVDVESKTLIKEGLASAVASGNTNMRAGLEDGLAALDQGSNRIRFAIFLTDGQLHPPGWPSYSAEEQVAERDSIFELASRFGEMEWSLFTVSLASAAEPEFLQTLADNGGGLYREAPDAGRLALVFPEIFAAQKLDDFEILFDDCLSPGEERTISFPVHQYLARLSLFVTYSDDLRPQVAVIRPDGVPQSRTGGDARYDAFIVEAPMAGTWTVTASGVVQGESCLTISSSPRDLVEMELLSPTESHQLESGEPLPVRVSLSVRDVQTGEERPLDGADVSVVVIGSDGQSLIDTLQPDGNGEYSGQLSAPSSSGTYEFNVVAEVDDRIVARRSYLAELNLLPAVAPTPQPEPTATAPPPPGPTASPVVPVDAGGGGGSGGGGVPLLPLLLAPVLLIGAGVSYGAYLRLGKPLLRGILFTVPQNRAYDLERLHKRVWSRRPLTVGGPDDDIDLGIGRRLIRIIAQKKGTPVIEVVSDADEVAVNDRRLLPGQRWRLIDESALRLASIDLVYRESAGWLPARP